MCRIVSVLRSERNLPNSFGLFFSWSYILDGVILGVCLGFVSGLESHELDLKLYHLIRSIASQSCHPIRAPPSLKLHAVAPGGPPEGQCE
jgi:hypothetical protein